MPKRFIYFVTTPPDLWMVRQYGMETLLKYGYEVEVWDFTALVYADPSKRPIGSVDFPHYRTFEDSDGAVRAVSALGLESFVILLCSLPVPRPKVSPLTLVLQALSRSEVEYCQTDGTYSPPTPYYPEQGAGKGISEPGFGKKLLRIKPADLPRYVTNTMEKWCHRVLLSYVRPLQWRLRSRIDRREYDDIGVKPPSIVLLSGGRATTVSARIGAQTRLLKAPHISYFDYLEESAKLDRSGDQTAVFLDSYLPFHSSANYPLAPEDYYPEHCRFFDLVEQALHVRVVIAAHPTANYEALPDYYQGREIRKYQTCRLTMQARFVITNASSSVNFAVLFDKPILFVTSGNHHKWAYRHAAATRILAETLGKRPIRIDESPEIDWDQELMVDRSAYDQYREDYIKEHTTPEKHPWLAVAELATELYARK